MEKAIIAIPKIKKGAGSRPLKSKNQNNSLLLGKENCRWIVPRVAGIVKF